jgi:hypothetical protein
MTGEPPHAPRPDRPPGAHRIPKAWDRKPDPFNAAAGHQPPLSSGREDEPGGNDRWTAIKSAVLVILAGALITWMLISLLR